MSRELPPHTLLIDSSTSLATRRQALETAAAILKRQAKPVIRHSRQHRNSAQERLAAAITLCHDRTHCALSTGPTDYAPGIPSLKLRCQAGVDVSQLSQPGDFLSDISCSKKEKVGQ